MELTERDLIKIAAEILLYSFEDLSEDRDDAFDELTDGEKEIIKDAETLETLKQWAECISQCS
jgi:hypothetical protein